MVNLLCINILYLCYKFAKMLQWAFCNISGNKMGFCVVADVYEKAYICDIISLTIDYHERSESYRPGTDRVP